MPLNDRSYLTLLETKAWLSVPTATTTKDDQIIRHINTACARVESYIQSPVLSREFVEYFDGNNSNVIVPSHYPVESIDEIVINLSGEFETSDPLNTEAYALRHIPSLAIEEGVIGLDVVLRDTSSVDVIGRIVPASSVQSIRITYTAGRGDADTMPDDLKTATLMMVEYLYILKENRELGVSSKGVMGQSYQKREVGDSGMPKEIEAMLNSYVDSALPSVAVPQRNANRI